MVLKKLFLGIVSFLREVNDAFCKSHSLLAQKVVTRSARAAVSKIGADALVSKALSVRRAKAGSLLKTIREVNALKLEENDILVGHGYHTAGSEPYFFINSYTYIDLNGRCVVAEEIGDRDKDTMRPLKWKCTNECRKLTSEEVALVLRTKSLFQMSIEDLRAGLDGLDSGCSHVHTDITLKLHSGFIEQLGHPIYCELPECHPPQPAEAAAELPPPPPVAAAALPPLPTAELPHLQQQKQEHRYLHQPHQYWHQYPHHHFACCHPGRCHHHPHGSHGLNQAAEVRDEAGGEEEDKAEPYGTLRTQHIISIIKFFNLPPSLRKLKLIYDHL